MNKRSFLVIIFLLFFSIVLFSGSTNRGPDKQIAELYLKTSIEQFQKGNFADSYSLSGIALSFNPANSDTKLIHAVSGRNSGLSKNSIDELSNSIILDKWNFYSEASARYYLSKFMYLNGDVDKAYLNLAPFSRSILDTPEFADFFIRISLGVGRQDAALKMAEDLLKLDPFNSYAQLILARYSPIWLENSLKIILQGDPSNSISKQLVQYLIKNRSDCSYLRKFYLNKWGEDRFYKISNLCIQSNNLKDELILIYPENSFVDYNELLWIYSLFDTEKEKNAVISRLNSITITVKYDIDNDGFNDTKAIFKKGRIVSFSFDGNNDNNEDYIVDIDILPVSLTLKTPGQTTSYYYNKYPHLVSAALSNENFITEYQLIPYELDMDIIHLPSNIMEGIPSIKKNAVIPDNYLISVSSTRKTITNKKNNNITEFKEIDPGQSVERVINSKNIKVLERYYKNSILITAYKDSDNDGVFDTVFKYSDGNLQSISFDGNNNGIAEYIQNFEDGSVKTWDFNEDGIIDSRERMQDGALIREMSSKFDGVMDTIINIDSDNK